MPELASEYDVVVIGTGPGGEGAAMQAVKNGRSVAVIEREAAVGGNCTHRGTIPSKALRYAIFEMAQVNANVLFREHGITANFMIPDLRRRAKSVIEQQVKMRTTFYDRNEWVFVDDWLRRQKSEPASDEGRALVRQLREDAIDCDAINPYLLSSRLDQWFP